MTKYILLWLEGPLQSWGYDSQFDRRDTLSFPTKSGVFGLVLAALGATGEQRPLLAKIANCSQTIIALQKRGGEIPSVLMDFHMVGSGYRAEDEWEQLHIPKTSTGEKKADGTKVTHRYYLQDAIFAVIQEFPADLAPQIAEALQRPVFHLSLGRKNCVPSEWIFQGVFDEFRSAEDRVREMSRSEAKSLEESFRVTEGEGDVNETRTLNDVPVSFGVKKEYKDRRVSVCLADGRNEEEPPVHKNTEV